MRQAVAPFEGHPCARRTFGVPCPAAFGGPGRAVRAVRGSRFPTRRRPRGWHEKQDCPIF